MYILLWKLLILKLFLKFQDNGSKEDDSKEDKNRCNQLYLFITGEQTTNLETN